jgi:two-component system, OmpR family, sensor histidine kinase MtrB
MTLDARHSARRGTPAGRGLRTRVIVGSVAVSVATAVVTGTTAIIGVLVAVSNRQDNYPRRQTDLEAFGERLADWSRVVGVSNLDPIWLVAAAGIGLAVISIGSGWLVSRRILRPVQRLAAAADQVAAGDLSIRLNPLGRDELAQLATTFNLMTGNLDRSMSDLRRLESQARRFAADVSHELRTPLAAMSAVTDVLADETPGMSPNAARAARLVIREIAHLDQLVTDLIEMSRFDAGTAVLDTDVVDVSSVVRACLARRGWAGRVKMSIPPALVAVLDRRRFDVIIANLVGNSMKYGAAPVEVQAIEDTNDSRLLITVTDRGPGLSAAALEHVFERFYKADGARTRSDGSGLGLAIAAENARLHGGTLTAENRPDGGALFRLDLPTSPRAGSRPG